MLKLLFCLLATLSFCSIGFSDVNKFTTSAEDWKAKTGAIYEDAEETDDLSGVKVPLLMSSALEEKWGKPQMGVSEDGSYFLQYSDPENSLERLVILGFSKPLRWLESAPDEEYETLVNGELGLVFRSQKWKTVTLKIPTASGKLKIPVQYFRASSGGGADGPQDSTNTFMIKLNGMEGFYVVSMESVSEKPPKRFKLLNVK